MFNIIQLLKLSYKKIVIEFDEGVLEEIMQRDKKFLACLRPNDPDYKNLHEKTISKFGLDEHIAI